MSNLTKEVSPISLLSRAVSFESCLRNVDYIKKNDDKIDFDLKTIVMRIYLSFSIGTRTLFISTFFTSTGRRAFFTSTGIATIFFTSVGKLS